MNVPVRDAVGVLFVCMGNICRSPTAEAVFRRAVEQAGLAGRIEIDSAGTHAYHVGEPPDRRAQAAARVRGFDMSGLRARAVASEDYARWDYLLAMDADNLDLLARACPDEHRHRLQLFLDYAPEQPVREVPDPYYGGAAGFEQVLDLVEAASAGLLDDIRRRLGVR